MVAVIASFLIRWKKKGIGAGWLLEAVDHQSAGTAGDSEYFYIKKIWTSLHKRLNLRKPSYRKTLIDHLRNSGFERKFGYYRPDMSGENGKLFYLELSYNWEIPWELILEDWPYHILRKTALIRVQNFSLLISAPIVFEEKLQILIVEGSQGNSEGNIVNIQAETEEILLAIGDLPTGIKSAIATPQVCAFRTDTLRAHLDKYIPNLIWFNCHGTNENQSALLDVDNKWIPANDLIDIIMGSD